jgi:hypothetical protein
MTSLAVERYVLLAPLGPGLAQEIATILQDLGNILIKVGRLVEKILRLTEQIQGDEYRTIREILTDLFNGGGLTTEKLLRLLAELPKLERLINSLKEAWTEVMALLEAFRAFWTKLVEAWAKVQGG